MRNIAIQLAYDGTDFVGSQYQRTGRSVQAVLEQAWTRLTGEDQRWTFAGRTDAGVHAHGQVANVRTTTTHSLPTIQRALNALLPRDVAVRDVWEAEPEFHARFSAVRREYRYTILHEPWPVPLLRRTSWQITGALDVAAMQAAATLLLGEHDFATFGVVDAGPTVRVCTEAMITPELRDGYRTLVVALGANGFLRHMVRAIVGTLVEVGQRKRSVSDFGAVLASRDRRKAGPTAPPHGLSLVAVIYGGRLPQASGC